jgi:transmembrane sensor
MTRAHDPLSRTADTIEQEAAEWLVKVEQDGAPDTSRALAAWLGANPRHRAAFLRISTAWRRADVLRRLADPNEEPDPDLLAPERPPANESITEPTSVARLPLRPPRPTTSQSPRAFRLAVAAMLSAIVIGATVWLTHNFSTSQTYATAIGEFHRITLADGSQMSLNTNTRVRVSYTASRREVELLQGEALFEVARDKARPFVVAAGHTAVRAVGTAFVVRLRSTESVDVLVTEGRVSINPPSQAVVSAGEIALVRNNTITQRAVDDITRRTSWLEGMLIFRGETLSEVVSEFNRYNVRKIQIADPAIAGKKIGGAFKSTNPDLFATALEKTFDVDVRVHEGTYGSEIRLSSGTP